MNNLTRLVIASGAGLLLAFTVSPASAAPSSHSRSNPAVVEYVEYSNPDGTYTREYRSVTRYTANEHYTTNSRDQEVINGTSFDYKKHYMLNGKVTKMTSQTTGPDQYGETCRTNSQTVITNGETRVSRSGSVC